ncbi:SufE family protein [Schlesneria paludicola]|uniref:SufE family protein n=1 Tax=Schlesneria paludicola TaxID=360056 RepID=UPI00029A4C34|nr:SufE family protein [Schlesneria paludicola]
MRLSELIEEFVELEPEEKLEWLVDFSNELPDISSTRRAIPFPDTCRIQECQTPVHMWVTANQGLIHLEADVPRKSPTIRGLVAMVVQGLEGCEISEALSMPDDMVAHLGLTSVLGMTRQQGFRGVISRIKRELRAIHG